MPFVETPSTGTLNGSTPVVIVDSPLAGRRVVGKITFYNRDTAAVTITLVKTVAGTDRFLGREVLNPADTWQPVDPNSHLVLDDDDQSVRAFMSAAAATTNPDFDASFAVVTDA